MVEFEPDVLAERDWHRTFTRSLPRFRAAFGAVEPRMLYFVNKNNNAKMEGGLVHTRSGSFSVLSFIREFFGGSSAKPELNWERLQMGLMKRPELNRSNVDAQRETRNRDL